MTNLMLQPTGDPDDYEVTADEQTVGRIVLLAGAWSWAIDSAFRPGRHPAYGFEPTRDAASAGVRAKLVCQRVTFPLDRISERQGEGSS